MTFLNVSLAYLGKWYSLNEQVLSFVLTAKYEFENKSSQYKYNTLPQHVFQFVHNVRFFYVGDEYRSTGRNVSTNLQILAGILSVFITPKFGLLVKSE